MSQENIELVQSFFYRWNAGDHETFDGEIRPDAKIFTTMLGGPQDGPDGVRRWFRRSRSRSTMVS